MTKLHSTVTSIGAECELFLQEKMMILFHEDVPKELKEIAVVHNNRDIKDDVAAGDFLVIGDERYEILFVGSKANETLRELGHATFFFNGESSSDLPGNICLEDKAFALPKENEEIKIIAV
ncbi:PTS glucitol/sorbitol transporter subunit IIA [Paenalkalicoccus suaedae]|uniref:PTS glucitol/sorbitol transporter subunit IIA n=2 Tax=Paenalkalicoccus suaedae TaxID=2592382 RepID=A0A859FKL6_9BACI|nr:PTS glucitol/sorbitol transporter subunit IIA [Paenalkalicoccus suaedae]